MNYTWKIEALEYAPELNGLKKVITSVHWRYIGTDGEISQDVYGVEGVEIPEDDEFIAYEDLTEQIVIEWLESKLDVEKLQENLANQIEAIKNPKVVVDTNPFN